MVYRLLLFSPLLYSSLLFSTQYVPVRLPRLLSKGADGADTPQHLVRHLPRIGQRLLVLLGDAAHEATVAHGADGDSRDGA